ncbi:MAG: ammonia monooxygenase [Acidocella sp. 20-61-6]|nr:MAG: ammonia monooxygenase [Acidocella sp. 20-61-6]
MKLLLQWALLLALSGALERGLDALRLPAALLLGPMAAAIIFAAAGTALRIPGPLFMFGQAIIGCMIASHITGSILQTMLADWPIFIMAVLAVIIASNAFGWLLTRLRVLPGSTALWGSAPGGATAMVLMSEAFGADLRLVAFMQYLRVVLVAVVATLVARFFALGNAAQTATHWFPHLPALPFGETLSLAVFGAVAGRVLRIPAGPLLVPIGLGAMLHIAGAITFVLPPWLLAGSYALVGWTIGLRFSRPILRHAAHALPRVALSILTLIAVCGGLAAILTYALHIDPLTAYLAMSPGGIDSVAIIAASSPQVNIPFIMAMQTARFLCVLFLGPPIVRALAKSFKKEK